MFALGKHRRRNKLTIESLEARVVLNAAPVLDGSVTFALRDTIQNSEQATSVADMLVSRGFEPITDSDVADPTGIGVFAADNSFGTWQYSIDEQTWLDVTNVSETSAIVLTSNAMIRFSPNADYSGSAGLLSFRAWDRSENRISGQDGVDMTNAGGATPFSEGVGHASLDVRTQIIVDTAEDVVDANDGKTSVREAVTFANNASSEARTAITFAPGIGALELTEGQLSLANDIMISAGYGGESEVSISGGGSSRIFHIESVANVELRELQLSDGLATGVTDSDRTGGAILVEGELTLIDSTVTQSHADSDAGAIQNSGIVYLVDSVLEQNSAGLKGGAISNTGSLHAYATRLTSNSSGLLGGAIFDESGTTIHLERVELRDNASTEGGALALAVGSGANLIASTLAKNSATQSGGAVFAESFSAVDSTFEENTAADSGGAVFVTGAAHISNSMLMGNRAEQNGGAILNAGTLDVEQTELSFNSAGSEGGAIHNEGSTVLQQSTLRSNRSLGDGGAIKVTVNNRVDLINSTVAYNDSPSAISLSPFGSLNAIHSTIAYNSSVGVLAAGGSEGRIHNSIVANNGSADVDGFVHAMSSLIEDTSATRFDRLSTRNVLQQDPKLVSLAQPFMFGLLADSPAIDNGDNALSVNPGNGQVLESDQRGSLRQQNRGQDNVDIGSFEYSPTTILVNTTADENDNLNASISLREAVTIARNQPGIDMVVFDPSLIGQTVSLSVSLNVNTDIIFAGPGRDQLTISNNEFFITKGSTTISGITLDGVMLRNFGSLNVVDSVVQKSNGTINGGQLFIDNSQFIDQTAPGVSNSAEAVITNSEFARNTRGLSNVIDAANLRVRDSRIVDNTSDGVKVIRGTATLDRTSILNSGGDGISTNGNIDLEDTVIRESSLVGMRVDSQGIAKLDRVSLSQSTTIGVFSKGDLTIRDSEIIENNSVGIWVLPGSRASITGGTLTANRGAGLVVESEVHVTDSAISNNLVSGIIVQNQGDLKLSGSMVQGNSNHGIDIAQSGSANVLQTTVDGNLRTGINARGSLKLSASTVSKNILTGVDIRGNGDIFNSTISGNESSGILINSGASALIVNSTIAENHHPFSGAGIRSSSVDAAIYNSIVANNIIGDGTVDDEISGFASGGNNFIGEVNESGGLTVADGNLFDLDPMIGPLANNGGPTMTHAILTGSPAIDFGDNSKAVEIDESGIETIFTSDQRGEGRFENGVVDAGSYELLGTDTDNDGISDAAEDGAPNDGDGNGDATFDRLQSNVVSYPNAVSSSYLTIQSDEVLSQVRPTMRPGDLTVPDGFDFSAGYMSFQINDLQIGESIPVTLFLAEPFAVSDYFASNGSDLQSIGEIVIVDANSDGLAEQVGFNLVDGSFGDADGIANGVIVHLGGLATEVEAEVVVGDSNHDGVFNSGDLIVVFQAGEFEDGIPNNSTFEEGDWDGDGDFTTSDLVEAFKAGTFSATAVPQNSPGRMTRYAASVDQLFAADDDDNREKKSNTTFLA